MDPEIKKSLLASISRQEQQTTLLHEILGLDEIIEIYRTINSHGSAIEGLSTIEGDLRRIAEIMVLEAINAHAIRIVTEK